MSEVDRLSNSGLHPALPIADKRRSRERAPDGSPWRRTEAYTAPAEPAAEAAADGTGTYRIPKSLIDDFA